MLNKIKNFFNKSKSNKDRELDKHIERLLDTIIENDVLNRFSREKVKPHAVSFSLIAHEIFKNKDNINDTFTKFYENINDDLRQRLKTFQLDSYLAMIFSEIIEHLINNEYPDPDKNKDEFNQFKSKIVSLVVPTNVAYILEKLLEGANVNDEDTLPDEPLPFIGCMDYPGEENDTVGPTNRFVTYYKTKEDQFKVFVFLYKYEFELNEYSNIVSMMVNHAECLNEYTVHFDDFTREKLHSFICRNDSNIALN